jgi:hypothetical protein
MASQERVKSDPLLGEYQVPNPGGAEPWTTVDAAARHGSTTGGAEVASGIRPQQEAARGRRRLRLQAAALLAARPFLAPGQAHQHVDRHCSFTRRSGVIDASDSRGYPAATRRVLPLPVDQWEPRERVAGVLRAFRRGGVIEVHGHGRVSRSAAGPGCGSRSWDLTGGGAVDASLC